MGHFIGPPSSLGIVSNGIFGNPVTAPSGWTTLVTGFEASPNFFRTIDFVNGTFVISTNNGSQLAHTVIASPDGVTWSQHSVVTTAQGFRSEGVAFGAGVYVFVIDNAISTPRVYTSPDLVTWTLANPGFAAANLLSRPRFGNGVFLLTSLGTAHYATSPDGTTWTQQSTYAPKQWLVNPIFDGTRFVAPVLNASSVGKLAVSTDGVNWTESSVSLAAGSNLFALAANAATLYDVGNASTDSGDSVNGALSSDTAIAFNDSGNPTQQLCFGGGRWTRCNQNTATVQSSLDGVSFSQDSVPAAANFFNDIAFGLGEFIAVGGDNSGNNYAAFRLP